MKTLSWNVLVNSIKWHILTFFPTGHHGCQVSRLKHLYLNTFRLEECDKLVLKNMYFVLYHTLFVTLTMASVVCKQINKDTLLFFLNSYIGYCSRPGLFYLYIFKIHVIWFNIVVHKDNKELCDFSWFVVVFIKLTKKRNWQPKSVSLHAVLCRSRLPAGIPRVTHTAV